MKPDCAGPTLGKAAHLFGERTTKVMSLFKYISRLQFTPITFVSRVCCVLWKLWKILEPHRFRLYEVDSKAQADPKRQATRC